MKVEELSVLRRCVDLQLALSARQIVCAESADGLSRLAFIQAAVLQMCLGLKKYVQEVTASELHSLEALAEAQGLDFRGRQLQVLLADKTSWVSVLRHCAESVLECAQPAMDSAIYDDSNIITSTSDSLFPRHWSLLDHESLKALHDQFNVLVDEHRNLAWEG